MFTKRNKKTENMNDPNAVLEKALMEEYLHERGYSLEKLKEMPKEMVEQLMKEATRYASLKMEDVKAKAHFVEEIHEQGSSHK
jgi:hypothetical protein